MDTLLKIIIGILCLLIMLQLVYSYITFSSFSCPDCPECPEITTSEIIMPSNDYIINYINKTFLDINDDIKSIDFLKTNVLFADNYIVNFEQDAESIMTRIRTEVDNKDDIFNEANFKYIQSFDNDKKSKFNLQYNIKEYPSPLIYFEGSKLLFAYLKSQNIWKILIDIGKYQ
jgi:hypothetical protein